MCGVKVCTTPLTFCREAAPTYWTTTTRPFMADRNPCCFDVMSSEKWSYITFVYCIWFLCVFRVIIILCHIHALIGPAQIFNKFQWLKPSKFGSTLCHAEHPSAFHHSASWGERRFSPGTCWAVPWFGRKQVQRIWRGWCPVIPCNLGAMEKWCKNARFLESCWKNCMSSYHWFCGFVCYREIHLNNRGEKSGERKRQSIAVHLQNERLHKVPACSKQQNIELAART